jgi:glycosyltransferase involved in cell wall biosynthesis
MLFSVVICVSDSDAYLLPFTLDSVVAQGNGEYEIIVIDGQRKAHSLDLFKAYASHISKIEQAYSPNLSVMMNQGLRAASGRYLHFLLPGEFYISRHVLAFMAEYLPEHDYPDLIHTGYIVRHSLSQPQMIFRKLLTVDLKRGNVPSTLQSFWFKREAICAIEGFDPSFTFQGGIELVYRLFLSRHVKKTFKRRILTDYEYRRPSHKKVVRQFWETLVILFRRCGPGKALFWWMAQNHLRLLRWWLSSLKMAIWRSN